MIVFEHILPRDQAIGATVDYTLDVDWTDLHKRAVRKNTRDGRRVGILLLRNVYFEHDDVLRSRDGQLLRIHHLPSPVLVADALTTDQATTLAWLIGNLHLPIEVTEQAVITLDDGPTEALLRQLGVSFTRETRRFKPLSPLALPRFSLAGR